MTRRKPFMRSLLISRRSRVALSMCTLTLVAAATILLINAERLRAQTRQMNVPKTENGKVDMDQLEIASVLAEFLAVPSYSYTDPAQVDESTFTKLHKILERRFPATHRALHRERINDLSLLYHWQGTDASLQPILLMSHLDVVPVEAASEDEWEHPPHAGAIADGFVWGRGALDVKSGVVGIMAAVEHLLRSGFQPERSVYLAFGHDEEVGGTFGNAAIATELAVRGVQLEFVLDEGGAILNGIIPGATRPVAFVAIAEKRMAEIELTARGNPGHGSMGEGTAARNLAEAIVRLREQPMPVQLTEATATLFDFLGPELPLAYRVAFGNRWLFEGMVVRQFTRSASTEAVVRSTMNVTSLRTESNEGEMARVNQVPTLCKASLDTRLLPGQSSEDACRHIRCITRDLLLKGGESAIECRVLDATTPEKVSSVKSDSFQILQRTIHEVFSETVVAAGLTSVTTDSRWYFPIAEDVYRFIPMRVEQDDMRRIHGVNERIGVENLSEIVQFYVQLIRRSTTKRI